MIKKKEKKTKPTVSPRSGSDVTKYQFSGQAMPGAGHPGGPNIKTRLRRLLDVIAKTEDGVLIKKALGLPEAQSLDYEDVMHGVQIIKAIKQQDTNAYKAIMDQAHDKPKQPIEGSGSPIVIFEVPKE